jgi:hypothetical protein
VSIIRTRLAVIPLALMIGGTAIPAAYSQTDSAKTGVEPRGTKVAPSTEPSQASSPRPPSGQDKSGTPVSKEGSAAAAKPTTKP